MDHNSPLDIDSVVRVLPSCTSCELEKQAGVDVTHVRPAQWALTAAPGGPRLRIWCATYISWNSSPNTFPPNARCAGEPAGTSPTSSTLR